MPSRKNFSNNVCHLVCNFEISIICFLKKFINQLEDAWKVLNIIRIPLTLEGEKKIAQILIFKGYLEGTSTIRRSKRDFSDILLELV